MQTVREALEALGFEYQKGVDDGQGGETQGYWLCEYSAAPWATLESPFGAGPFDWDEAVEYHEQEDDQQPFGADFDTVREFVDWYAAKYYPVNVEA